MRDADVVTFTSVEQRAEEALIEKAVREVLAFCIPTAAGPRYTGHYPLKTQLTPEQLAKLVFALRQQGLSCSKGTCTNSVYIEPKLLVTRQQRAKARQAQTGRRARD